MRQRPYVRLSRNFRELTSPAAADAYDVIVVGSGYGAAACAARLARAELRVCVLERGREYPPGSFPKSCRAIQGATQIRAPLVDHGSRLGLYDFRVHPELSVLVGCGLGGTSLINANVSIRPDRQVFTSPRWPAALRDQDPADPRSEIHAWFDRAERVLRPQVYPLADAPPKLAALQRAAQRAGFRFQRARLNVSFAATDEQPACHDCGNCVTGCNTGAKNTVPFTYLPMAAAAGAAIHTCVEVHHVAPRDDGRYDVVFHALRHDGRPASDRPSRLAASAVVLGAGALGSTEILLRSAARGLRVSPRLGHGFSGNGDALVVGYECDERLDSVSYRARRDPRDVARWTGRNPHVGPAITGIVDLRRPAQPLEEQVIIEEGAFPAPLQVALRHVAQLGAALGGEVTSGGVADWLRDRWRELRDLLGLTPLDGALNASMVYLCMGHDGADGRLELDGGERIRVAWPGLAERTVFRVADAATARLTAALGGSHLPNPLWRAKLLGNLMTVHPLGGCNMSDDADGGVVDERGRVWDGAGGVHERLFVADGAVVPTSLGVNPLWTITALAERIAHHALLALDRRPVEPLRPGAAEAGYAAERIQRSTTA